MKIERTYEELLADTLDDLKAKAAVATTYGHWFRLEEAIESELEWIREMIRKSDHDVAAEHQRCRSFFARFRERCELYERWLDRAAVRREIERAHRDELKDGLAEWRRQWKADVAAAEREMKVIDEIKNRKH